MMTPPKPYRPGFLYGIGIGLLLALPLIAVSSAANALLGLPLVPSDVMDTLPNVLPVDLLNFGKQAMVEILSALNLARLDVAAKPAELVIGTLTLLGVCGLVMGAAYALTQRSSAPEAAGSLPLRAGVLLGAVMALIHAALPAVQFARLGLPILLDTAFILLCFAVWGYAAGAVYAHLSAPAASTDDADAVQQLDRRQFLVRVGGSAAVLTVVGAAVGYIGGRSAEQLEPLPDTDLSLAGLDTDAAPIEADYAADFVPAGGTRPEYTPLAEHYRIDIVQNPPDIDGVAWRLPVSGLVENPAEWTLDDLRAMPAASALITMSCISNPIGGPLISTTKWTGVPMQHILELVKPTEEAAALKITCADGFDEYIYLDVLKNEPRILLAYAWDDRPLLQKHGFPLRIHIPDLYGMKQPKWITGFEFVDRWNEGYWVRRGWSDVARVQLTSVVDTVAVSERYEADGQTLIPVGGIAYAGARGISRVEIKVDDGEWQPAVLKQPLSERTWVLWRYDWPYAEGTHTFRVRAFDGAGREQTMREAPVRPDGATGYHLRRQTV